MHYGKTAATAFAAAAFLVIGAGTALAVPAQATGSVNVRTGPGVGYHKVDSLHAGELVDVQQCQSGWCFVTHRGPDGWVSANYLGGNGYGVNVRPRPNVSIQLPGFGFSFGNPEPDRWPRTNRWPRPFNPFPNY